MSGAISDRPAAAGRAALARVLDRLGAQLDELVARTTDAIFAENLTYGAQAGERLRADVGEHVREHFVVALASFSEQREPTREDLLFIRRYAARRVGQLTVADFIHSFHVGQRILWEATLALADDEPSRRAVLGLVSLIVRYFDVATTHAAEVYLEAEQLLGADGERLRRDALEALLAGEEAASEQAPDALRDAGLDPDTPLLVISALSLVAVEDPHAMRSAAASLASTTRRRHPPLTVIRQGEIVVVTPASDSTLAGAVSRLAGAQRRLEQHGFPLAVGMSTIHSGLGAVPAAYREAIRAREMLAAQPGVVALPAMSTFDYMVRHSGPTARRLIPSEIARFVAEDVSNGGVLLQTLVAFADADLNVKQAAESLHVHVNTARYRLARIAERTGADLRHVGDLIELLIAVQLAPAPASAAEPSGRLIRNSMP